MKNNGKIMDFLKNKNTVTALCAILIVAILIIGYQVRVNKATMPVEVPFAKETIQPRTQITPDMIDYKKVPAEALGGNFYGVGELRAAIQGGQLYTNVNTLIPAGSLFYKDAVSNVQELPDSALFGVPEGETLYYLTVNMLSTYQNSILPGKYIDIYATYKENDHAYVGKLFANVKVLAVKTADGQNVFENGDETRVPSVILFSLKEENHLILRRVDAIMRFGLGEISIFPIPTTAGEDKKDSNLETYVTSDIIVDFINQKADALPENILLSVDNNTGTSSGTEPKEEQ